MGERESIERAIELAADEIRAKRGEMDPEHLDAAVNMAAREIVAGHDLRAIPPSGVYQSILDQVLYC